MISIRPARPDDSAQAAFLIRLTMGGTAELFADGASRLSPEQLLAALFRRPGGRLSYQHGFILEADQAPLGLLISFPASGMTRLDLTMGANLLSTLGFPAMMRLTRRMLPMMKVREAERGEYYISNIAVHPDAQRRGYGALLLAFAEEQAGQLGLQKCSLIVNQHNADAIRLYQRFGYRIVHSGQYPGPLAEIEGGYDRMVKDLK
jgi:ribosomal protein S18 acetylase RimI-like enzyme